MHRIACGPYAEDWHWSEVLMRESTRWMDGLALHYYCGSGRQEKGSATDFTEDDWFAQLQRALRIDAMIARHTAIMDRWDPEGNVGLYVDEWGAWHGVEPGTNPRFLYQQNSLRDALVASTSLDIFNNHARRVVGANIAQTVNVLQAMVLTEGDQLILTPTFHVFEMYNPTTTASCCPCTWSAICTNGRGKSIPGLSASATRADDGSVFLTVSNLHPSREITVPCQVRGHDGSSVTARVLTAGQINSHNTFEAPSVVPPRSVTAVTLR